MIRRSHLSRSNVVPAGTPDKVLLKPCPMIAQFASKEVIPSNLILVAKETVVGLSRKVWSVEGRELVVVKNFILEVTVKSCHHDINEDWIRLV